MAKQAITFVVDDEKDADVLNLLNGQTNKSAMIREAIRAYGIIEAAIRQTVSRELACLPDVVALAVRDALADYNLSPPVLDTSNGDEDPAKAAIIDEQLANFFEDG